MITHSRNKYLSFNHYSDLILKNKVNTILSPCGTGKTRHIKKLIADKTSGMKTLILTPYILSINEYSNEPVINGKVKTNYMTRLIRELCEIVIDKHGSDYNSHKEFFNKLDEESVIYLEEHGIDDVILDEVDVFIMQCKMAESVAEGDYSPLHLGITVQGMPNIPIPSTCALWVILRSMCKAVRCLGFSANTIEFGSSPTVGNPSKIVNVIHVDLQHNLRVKEFNFLSTSGLKPSAKTVQVRNLIKNFKNSGKKTLVFTSRMNISLCNFMATLGDKVKVIIRNENIPTERLKNGEDGTVTRGRSVFYVINKDHANPEEMLSDELYKIADLVFIPVSCTRAVSLRIDYGDVNVLVLTRGLTRSSYQAMCRFRNSTNSITVVSTLDWDSFQGSSKGSPFFQDILDRAEDGVNIIDVASYRGKAFTGLGKGAHIGNRKGKSVSDKTLNKRKVVKKWLDKNNDINASVSSLFTKFDEDHPKIISRRSFFTYHAKYTEDAA